MNNIGVELGSIYSSLDLRLDKFESSVSKAIQGFYKLQTGAEKASSIMDNSVKTSVSNIAKSYELWEKANEKTGKSIFDNSKKIDSYKDRIKLLDDEIKKSEKTLGDIEKQCGKNSKEAEEYKSHVLDLKLSHAELTDEMKKAQKETGTFAGRLRLLGSEFEKIDKKYEVFDKVGDKFSSVGSKLTMGVTMPVVAAGTAATKFAMDFEKSSAKVSTIADTTKVSMDTLKKGVIDLSNKTGMSTTDLNDALYQSISAGVDTAHSVEFLGVAVKTAKAGFADTETAVDSLTTVLNAYGMKATDVTKISDQMMEAQNFGKTTFAEMGSSIGNVIPIAASLNVNTKELFSSLAVLTKNGIKTSEAVTGLKAAYSNILKPSDQASKMAKSLGLEFNAAHLKSVGWAKFLDEVKTKTGGNAEKMATLFGSVEGLNSVMVLTGKGAADFSTELGRMNDVAGLTDKSFAKVSDTTEARLKKGLNKLKNSAMELGVKLLPTVEKGINLISNLTDKFNSLSPSMQENIIKIGVASAALGPFLNGIGGTIKGTTELLKTGKKVGVFFGIFKEASTVATAVEGVGTAAKVAGGSGGLGLFAGGLGKVGSLALPAAGGIAAVGGAIYLAHKNTQYLNESSIKSAEQMGTMKTAMAGLNGHVIHTNKQLEEMNVKHKEWSKKVSPETQKALDGIANKIANYNMEVKGAAKLDKLADKETATKLNANLDDICNSAIDKIKSRQPEIQKTLTDSFKADGLDENEKKILDSLNKSGDAQVKKVQDIKKKILDLEKRASKETGAVRQKTLKEVEKLTQQIGNIEMKNTAKSKKELLAAQADFNARMKNLDMQGLSKLMESKAKARDTETKKIKESYDKQIEYLKLNAQDVDVETKKAINVKIQQLEDAKNKEIGVENEKYKGYLNAAIEKYPQLLNYIDMQHGTILTKAEQQKQLELNTYASKMKGMLDVTQTGYYQIKDSVTGQMHNCYVEVDKTTGQIVGAWDISTGKIYGNPIKAREDIDKDLKNGVKFQPIVTSYDGKKQEIWNNAVEVQAKENYNLFNWIHDAHSNAQSWLSRHPFIASVVQQVIHPNQPTYVPDIPQKWTGTDYFEGGLTWVDERGSELIQLPGKGPKLVDLPRGTKIFNHTQSNSMKERLFKKPKGYATGIDFAEPGIHEVAEDGFEIVASRQYKLFNGGEKVFNNKESKKILTSLLENKNKPEDIAKEAMSEAKESIAVKPRSGVSDSIIKDRLGRQLNWGANSKKEYQKYLEFIDKLNKEEIEKSKEYLKEDYENRVKSVEDRLRILKNENSIELQTEKARIDSQIAYYQKLQRNTKDKNAKRTYANKIAALRQYQKQVLNATKNNQKAQINSLERSKRALKEYYDDGMKLLTNREKEVKKSLKVQENVFKNTINEYNEAIKRLGIDTKDLNENLLNHQAIVILQTQKIKELENRYKELADTFGHTSEETVKAKKAFEEAKTELINMGNAVDDAKQKIIDAAKEADKKIADNINNMVDRVKNALKQRYEDELKAQENHINNELKNLDRWKDESIKRIESFYDVKIEAIDKQLVEEDKADKDAAEKRKIKQLESAIEYEHNEFNKAEMQKELNNLIKEREKRLHKEQLEEQKDKLQKEKENELKSINTIYESNKQSLEKQLEDYRNFYAKRINDAALQAQAEKMIMDNNQKDILELLHSYEEAYQQAGQSLGERLVEGFKPRIEELKSMLASVQSSFEDARTSALNSMAQSAIVNSVSSSSNISSATTDNRRSIVNHNSFTFNNPKALSPSEERRQTETMLRKIAFECR